MTRRSIDSYREFFKRANASWIEFDILCAWREMAPKFDKAVAEDKLTN